MGAFWKFERTIFDSWSFFIGSATRVELSLVEGMEEKEDPQVSE